MKDVHSRAGAFDTVRLAAALMVFHSHSFPIAGVAKPNMPGLTWGGIAVGIFFVVSGYWVTQSALQRSLVSFATARALRIFPGLAVCCVVAILGCSLASSIPVNAYLRSPKTWEFMWNAVPLFHSGVIGMPGVFQDGPLKDGVNGSLWTLQYEVFCYLLVGAAAVFGPKGVGAFKAAAGIFALAVLAQVLGVGPGALNGHGVFLPAYLQADWIASFVGAFAFGAWLYEANDRRLGQSLAVVAVAMVLSRHDPVLTQALSILFYGAIAIWIGRHLNLDRHVTRGQDLSYGVYIYAFPCQQLAARYFQPNDATSFAQYYFSSLTVVVVLAALSWTLVERPALLLKNPLAAFIERMFGRVSALAVRRPASAEGLDLAEQAGRPFLEVQPVDPHPVRGGRAGY